MAAGNLTQTSQMKCDHGSVYFYEHKSTETKTDMKFAIYLPPKAGGPEPKKCPVVYYLAGLTCNEQSFITNQWIEKAGATKVAAELNLILVCPDTSPRGCGINGENDSWDFGTSAGYYLDATELKWSSNYRMYSYITKELPHLIENNFPVLDDSRAIFGHSMGGHGAFICAFKNPGFYKSVSGLAAICNPMKCRMGKKALSGYLGGDKESWKQYDSCELAAKYSGPKLDILLDQGTDDGVLDQMLPENFVNACGGNEKVMLTYREQEGYDHTYYFVAAFIEDHLRHHAKYLNTES